MDAFFALWSSFQRYFIVILGRLLKMDQTQIICFLQDDIAKDFLFEDDIVIHSLKDCLEDLRKVRLDLPPPLSEFRSLSHISYEALVHSLYYIIWCNQKSRCLFLSQFLRRNCDTHGLAKNNAVFVCERRPLGMFSLANDTIQLGYFLHLFIMES